MERRTTEVLGEEERIPKIETSLILINKEDRILFGRRVGNNGDGVFTFPRGRLEYLERAVQSAVNGLREETGLSEKEIRLMDDNPVAVTEDLFPNGRHSLTLYFRANHLFGTPKRIIPNLYESWAWYQWDNLPLPLSLPIRNLINSGYDPFHNLR